MTWLLDVSQLLRLIKLKNAEVSCQDFYVINVLSGQIRKKGLKMHKTKTQEAVLA